MKTEKETSGTIKDKEAKNGKTWSKMEQLTVKTFEKYQMETCYYRSF